ncbi:hypothetical protein GALMADRAFT_258295 [Galerina marginata CBS 339.88]|uniref:Uncharacterized protein n=1 Tax=Galerina marginata (strain CBS 339.88) TaxID=685588 RepID=A0A067S8Y2_GALM3|nr:hypothetical protein GALMADRAFT_258295 [Galerina marginata CBS 339.88]
MSSPNHSRPHNQLRRRPRVPLRISEPITLPRRSTDSIVPSSAPPCKVSIAFDPRLPPSLSPRPLSLNKNESYIDDAFPWTNVAPNKFRYRHRHSASAPDIIFKRNPSFHSRLRSHDPQQSSPLTSPPLPPEPVPHVPVPYPPKTELPPPSTTSNESTQSLTVETNAPDVVLKPRNKLKKRRREAYHEDEGLQLFSQIETLFRRKSKPRPEEYATPNRLVLGSHFIPKYIPPSFDDGRVVDYRRRY